ncbi:MAG: VacJ family lipoprotein, partial [Cocleimonas sp.]|nr:VacJ family lipoprotein [Cocleimonas sp.]
MNLLTHQFIPYLFRKRHYFAVIFLSLSFVGCSALQADLTGDRGVTKVNYESTNWDAFNQDAYLFNKSLDDHVLKPIAIGYKKVTPAFLDTGISNVFSNLREVPNTINALLQFKLK